MDESLNIIDIDDKKDDQKEDIDIRIKQKISELDVLMKRVPETPKFLGSNVVFVEKATQSLFGAKKTPNISELRDEVNRFAEQKELSNPRLKIKRLIKKYPLFADLRALNGIQIFNDTLQSGLNERKLDVLETALVEIATALHNEAISIYNATWFIKVYLKYLEFLKERISRELNGITGHFNWQIRKMSDELQQKLVLITSLLAVKDKLSGMVMLNTKLKGSVYVSGCITKEEIRQASSALQHDETKMIGLGKTANYVILVIVTLGLLFSRIPILKNLVKDILATVPDISKDLILQKNMIRTMIGVTDFQLSLAGGDSDISKQIADKLFKRCSLLISQQLEFGTLTKPHEIDPFLKGAWIANESDGLFDKSAYKKMLVRALQFLKRVMENQSQIKGSYDLARQLQIEIGMIMTEYGWEDDV
ncbi:MAG: hypothetical protein HQ517_12735 [SAR324 cluster bacterium]|nr:hypothetical protein [SAR324 cluster bacterium]